MLARICGRDKRVSDVIKLPGDEQLAASLSKLFYKEEESIGQQQPSSSFFPFSLALRLRWVTRKTCRWTSSQRSLFFRWAETCAFIYFPVVSTSVKSRFCKRMFYVTRHATLRNLGISSAFKKHRLD